MQINLSFAYNAWWLIAAALLLAGFTVWIYRYTTPRVSAWLRKTLLVLRFLGIVFILALIFEPVLWISWRLVEKPVLAVLIDTSASMQLRDGETTRSEKLLTVLRQPWFEKLEERFTVFPILFSAKPEPAEPLLIDSLRFQGDGTDFQRAFDFAQEKLADRNFAAIVLLSDGSHNLGTDPTLVVGKLPVPIFAVPFGSEQPDNDLWIADVMTNEVAFAGTKVPVEVAVRSTGFAGQTAQVSLRQDGRNLATETVVLPADLAEQRLQLTFVPEDTGIQKFELAITELPNEVTVRNNRRSFYLKVLKNKLKIALVAGAPTPEVTFLRQALSSDAHLSVTVTVAVSPSTLAGDPLPDSITAGRLDCVLALQMPQNRNIQLDRWLHSTVTVKKRPLLFLSGLPERSADLMRYQSMLPLIGNPRVEEEREAFAEPTPQGLLNPILRVHESPNEARTVFENLPPIYANLRSLRLMPAAQVLLTGKSTLRRADGSTSEVVEPLLVVMRRPDLNTLTLFAGGLWRWHLMMQRTQPGNQFYERLMLNAVRWLVTAGDARRFRVTTSKEVYRATEEVLFSAQAYFEDFTPRDHLAITVRVQTGRDEQEFVLHGKGRGRYEGRLSPLAPGDYTYTAVAKDGDTPVAREQGRFTVQALRLEFLQTEANHALLRQLALRSGGAVLPADSLSQWADTLSFASRTLQQERSIQLWNRWPLAIVIVLLLSAEWYLRKREGML